MEMTSQPWLNGRWIVGGALILLGIFILLMNIGMMERFPVWKFWPVILIVIGINKFTEPYKRAEGFWLIGLGAWIQWSVLRMYDYGFSDTWPVVLILFGIYQIWEAFERDARKKQFQQTGTISVH